LKKLALEISIIVFLLLEVFSYISSLNWNIYCPLLYNIYYLNFIN